MKESRCPFPPEPLVAIKMEPGHTHGTYSSSSMMPPPPQYSVQSCHQEDGNLPTPPRVSAAHIHGSAEKQHQGDSSSSSIGGQHVVIRRVSLPIMTTTATASTPGNCMAPPHSVTPPSIHVTTDETLGAPPIEDDPVTLGGGGGSNSLHDGTSNHHHNHHYHRVSLPETS
jgi:hypothetical protein